MEILNGIIGKKIRIMWTALLPCVQNFSSKKQEKEQEHLGGHLAVSSLLLELS